jgi:hypothetical protein
LSADVFDPFVLKTQTVRYFLALPLARKSFLEEHPAENCPAESTSLLPMTE